MDTTKDPPQHQAQCSWAGKVRVSDSSTRCTLERLARQPVGSILTIPQDMQMADSAIWKRSMVGFFVSYKMPFHAVQAVANRIWKSMGLEKTMVLANGFMIFRFSTEAAIGDVLARGPWMFGGKAILLQQWHPGFQFDKNKIKTIPVWARLQGLPFPLWNKKGLSLAASMVGKPVASDEATLHGRRLEYARVCIEIDATVPLVHHFQVASTLSDEPITVDVTYEWKPAKCDTCHVFGHSCKNQGQKEVLEGKIVDNGNNTGSKAISTKTPLLDDQDTGEKEGPVSAAQQIAVPTATPKEGDMVSGATSPHGPSVTHQVVVPTAPMEGDKASGESSPHGSTNLDSMGQPKLQDRLKGHQGRKDLTGSIVKCMANKDSVGSSVHECDRDKGKGVIEENSDSFFNGNPQASPTASSSSTPKQKKKKKGGKKKKEAEGLRIIKSINLDVVQAQTLPFNWKAITNVQYNSLCRILVGWNPSRIDVTLIHSSAQWMTCDVRSISNSEITRITFVYGMNGYMDRSSLWHYIQESSVLNTNIPWTLLGDFNAIMRPSDRSGGSNNWVSHHDDFPNCIMLSSLQQIPYTGMHLSWHNSQSGPNTILKKLDWVFGNPALLIKWPAAKAIFLPRHFSDHSAMVLSLDAPHCRDKPAFKFLNQWAKHEDFLGIVNSIWQQRIVGTPIFQLTTKLMMLKAQFRQKHLSCTSHLSRRVFQAKQAWVEAQRVLDIEPVSEANRNAERAKAESYMSLCREEEAFYRQKSRIQWLQLGDLNTRQTDYGKYGSKAFP
ncbi:hypothetical protein OIU84_008431 [Salix udensis]|uniref:DUF4283 domain-containing protein n=1 Tax=Salix udensis TaxID=889485 RepID=A0AAD6NXR3_9ROSI|nr:hypothetical protein OIU84_008431 [Salix udensis]